MEKCSFINKLQFKQSHFVMGQKVFLAVLLTVLVGACTQDQEPAAAASAPPGFDILMAGARLFDMWYDESAADFIPDDEETPEILEFPCPPEESFKYEIAEAMACISAGKVESDIMPHAETQAIMETMDTLRAQWGLKYPGE